ncbi:MAG TPA: hypothetical protein VJ484_08985 [Lysobacter sp.]|nr:hypothetical protein [Lysobacter sp.]
MKSLPVPTIVRFDDAAIGKAHWLLPNTAADLRTAKWPEAVCGATAPSAR